MDFDLVHITIPGVAFNISGIDSLYHLENNGTISAITNATDVNNLRINGVKFDPINNNVNNTNLLANAIADIYRKKFL